MIKMSRIVEKMLSMKPLDFENGQRYDWSFDASSYDINSAQGRKELGWKAFDTDQDAWYFGFWVNPTTLQTLCYAEGDWTLIKCHDKESFNKEIRKCCEFYDGKRYCAVIDSNGTKTEYYQDRSSFFAV